MTNRRTLLGEIRERLATAPRLDAESRDDASREGLLLMSGVLRLAPGELSRTLGQLVSDDEHTAINFAAARRAAGEPLGYCVGWAPFRHLVLAVDARVLIPRPETEIVVEHALRLSADARGGIAIDIGTGSGAIALSLATEGSFEEVIATDVSIDALEVARHNAASLPSHAARARFVHGADLSPVRGERARLIVSNPPYISLHEAPTLPASVRDWEPPAALFAEDGGMARYDALLLGAPSCLEPGGWLVLELDATRAVETQQRAQRSGYEDVQLMKDLNGRPRVLIARVSALQTQRSEWEVSAHARG